MKTWYIYTLIIVCTLLSSCAFGDVATPPVEAKSVGDPRALGENAAPLMWRFCLDPKDQGDNGAKPTQYFISGYDDSGWSVVKPGNWNGTGAAWYRGWIVVLPDKPKAPEIRLPSGGDSKQVFLNGTSLPRVEGKTQEQVLAESLKEGLNCVAVKLERWPNRMTVTGDPTGISWHTEDGIGRVNLIVDSLPDNSSVTIQGPLGFKTHQAKSLDLPICVGLTHYGRYTLNVTAKGKSVQIPIHFLGISYFHWGWYGPAGCGAEGPGWNEFQPCSNKFMDQLFEKVAAHPEKHHAMSHDGWIYEDPSTQPLTKRGARGFAAVKQKDYIADTARLAAEGKLDFVGMPYVSRSADEADGEELIRSLRFSREIYKKQLGIEPKYCWTHDGSINPQLPQIMKLTGYDAYVYCENWWGQGGVPNTSDCTWTSMDGTSIDVLNSYYHGYGVVDIAKRAVRDGKPVVLSAEEYACLDTTKFYEESDRAALEKEGIIIRPISLDTYRREIATWAASIKATKDNEMAYKGWSGGDPTETEYESLNRVTEYKLAAAENAVSMARILGYYLPQSKIDEIWKTCLIYNDCHTHWGASPQEWRDELKEMRSRTEKLQQEAAQFVAAKVGAKDKSVVVVNTVGWKRSGSAKVKLAEGQTVCDAKGKPLRQERQGEDVLFWCDDIPSLGVKSYSITTTPATTVVTGASTKEADGGIELANKKLKCAVSKNGLSLTDAGGKVICKNACFYAVTPQEKRSLDPISTWDKPLNPVHYVPVELSEVKVKSAGPAAACVTFTGAISGYNGARIEGEVTLGALSDTVRINFAMIFDEPATIGVREAGCAHEGQYIPGIFFGSPCGKANDVVVDKAYCLAKDTLKCGNRETFMQLPFRNRTTNGLSLVAPDTGEFAILTSGLTDFFHVPWTDGNMIGVSLGSGYGKGGPLPYSGRFDYRISIMAPSGKLWRSYAKAQEEIVPLEAFIVEKNEGDLPAQASILSVDSDNAIITGLQSDGSTIQARVLELSEKAVDVSLKSQLQLSEVSISPTGQKSNDGTAVKFQLTPRALREVTAEISR